MKRKFFMALIVMITLLTLAACGSKDVIEIWVGDESRLFYQQKADDYIEKYNSEHEEPFPLPIEVKAVDSGGAAALLIADPTKGGDIITVPHDNLGKLISGSSAILPIESESLLNQIKNDNEDVYIDVTKGEVQGEVYNFGVPYVSQALVLYYNKKYIDTEQVKTWEGILEAARTAKKQALSLVGTDGFNNSFVLLTVDNETRKSSLQLYKDGDKEKQNAHEPDVLSAIKWGQSLFNDPNGTKRPTDSGWMVELKDEISLSVIGGAWHFKAAKSSLGNDLGIAVLPTFTLTEENVYDVANNPDLVGKVMRSGTFADIKMFVKNKESKHKQYLDDILEYFSSKEVQEESFIAAQNLPSYKNAIAEFEVFTGDNDFDPIELDLALAQIEMFSYGIPQPFGPRNYNYLYHQTGAPDEFLKILEDNTLTDAELKAKMLDMEYHWTNGKVRPKE